MRQLSTTCLGYSGEKKDKSYFYMQLEMMSDAIDETLDKDEAEEETEELTNQVKYCAVHIS
jgi:hypothetical protein